MGRKRVRERVYGPDGSAFFNCEKCGVSVAISLADMHHCESNKIHYRILQPPPAPQFFDHPRSPYRIFMETFTRGKERESYLEIERLGFEKWQNMSEEDKLRFVSCAELLDSCHRRELKREANQIIEINYGATSPLVEILNKQPQETLEKPQKT
ncbi:uncharacterized protein LOC131622741 [Vicia villosa]|uniref:uncharacterized protein LOC131622741 n=1 Tax=Vicia villosa TaxID=3911 RepID=UPI00273A9814|nr:uncharacterized protein LOC131622741 [Vicia villosa]